MIHTFLHLHKIMKFLPLQFQLQLQLQLMTSCFTPKHAREQACVVAECRFAHELGQPCKPGLAEIQHLASPHVGVLFTIAIQVQAAPVAAAVAWHDTHDCARAQEQECTVARTTHSTVESDSVPT